MFSTLLVDTVIFETPAEVNGEKLKMAANRYTTNNSSKSGVTLILTHASGTHKEHWEPVLENLLPQLQDSSFSIHEIWAFDWQSHGDSAVLNAGIFSRHEYAPTTVDWGNALATFVKAFLMNHRIVCIGHSPLFDNML
ncbi:hypothetical protein EW026_g5760 [Hermanssonia centrifuga]|uniref:AB hydrolase-1 domain-containing protein n=1 Tax=Hermanssonia centrifuga TaxID=98765 RepID=A0A4S4KD32_9APHY|nr:hypothetical protein EW026_g5760 [Hermanssonia centrifuga]